MPNQAKRNLERPHQIALARWLDFCGLLWMHVPNESKRNPITGKLLKLSGMSAGFPDVYIFDPPPNHGDKLAAAIELKPTKTESPKARVTPAQQRWLVELDRRDILTAVCYGYDDAVRILRAWGYGEHMRLRGACGKART